jgi:excisionase family DNA binding protein
MSILDTKFYTVAEVARVLRVDESTVRRHLKDGSIEHIELPGRSSRRVKRIPEDVLQRLLNPACAQPAKQKLPEQASA